MVNLTRQHLLPSCPYDRGGKICLTDHFKPLWARNVPKFGLAHLMALGVSLGYLVYKGEKRLGPEQDNKG